MQSFRIQSNARQLMAQARATTEISVVDAEVEEPLTRLLQSLNTEAQMSEMGARAMEQRLFHVLCNRLRMQRDFMKHPEINEQQIIRPLFLTGGGRSGSTKLHKMLAASGDFLYLPFWQGYSMALRSGERNEDSAPRINDASDFVRWFDQSAPNLTVSQNMA